VATPLFTYLHGRIPIRRHEHVAILYRGRAEAFRVASFLAEGLKGNDLCVYLAPEDCQAEMLDRVDCCRRLARPRLLGSAMSRRDAPGWASQSSRSMRSTDAS